MSPLPKEISELYKLKELDISNNDNLRKVPPELWKCRNLEKVNIKDCEYSAQLLKSLDSTLDCKNHDDRGNELSPKKVSWEDRPQYEPKLLIKFVTCAALFAMAIFTIKDLYPMNESKNECDELCQESCDNLQDDCQICQTVCKIFLRREKLDMDRLYNFKIFVAALSIILLLPHIVDVGNMMDQFLQVPFNDKIHKILERQEKLAGRIDELTVWRYNVYGFLGSLVDALYFCWCCCDRPWRSWNRREATNDVPNDVESDANHSRAWCDRWRKATNDEASVHRRSRVGALHEDVPNDVESNTIHSPEKKERKKRNPFA
jgi:hypothetical protein